LFIRNFYKGERSCPFSLEKLSLFSPFSPCAGSVAQGGFRCLRQRQGLLALDLGSIFEKLLHQKTFNFASNTKLISVEESAH
jgi:hypothetical protein